MMSARRTNQLALIGWSETKHPPAWREIEKATQSDYQIRSHFNWILKCPHLKNTVFCNFQTLSKGSNLKWCWKKRSYRMTICRHSAQKPSNAQHRVLLLHCSCVPFVRPAVAMRHREKPTADVSVTGWNALPGERGGAVFLRGRKGGLLFVWFSHQPSQKRLLTFRNRQIKHEQKSLTWPIAADGFLPMRILFFVVLAFVFWWWKDA